MTDSLFTPRSSQVELDDGTTLSLLTSMPDDQRGIVVLVHGIFGSKEDFDVLLPRLAEQGFFALSLDQRGVNESVSTGPYSLQVFAEDIVALIDGVNTEVPVHLVGQGFGGLVAQEAALMEPQFWDSVTFLGSGPGGMGRTRPLTFLEEGLKNGDDLEVLHDRFLAMLGGPDEDTDPALEERLATTDPQAIAAMVEAVENAPVRTDELYETGIPFHVVYGEFADAWPVTPQENMARDLETEATVLRDCGDDPVEDNPDRLTHALVENFLQLA